MIVILISQILWPTAFTEYDLRWEQAKFSDPITLRVPKPDIYPTKWPARPVTLQSPYLDTSLASQN